MTPDERLEAVYDSRGGNGEDAVREGVAVGDLDDRGRVYDVPAGARVCPRCEGYKFYEGDDCRTCGQRGWVR